MIPSRAWVKVGRGGVSFSPPMTWVSIRFSASSCWCLATRLTKTSQRSAHHTSPALCSSLLGPPAFGLRGGPIGSTTLPLMCLNVNWLFDMSVV